MTSNQISPHAGQAEHISADRAERLTGWWPLSPSSQIKTRDDRNKIEAALPILSQPCDGAWLMARVLTLLLPDFKNDMPESIRRMEGGDWTAALALYPQWAVERACRWWRSDENPDRRKKPVEGDIAARCKIEMGVVSMGRRKVMEYDSEYHKRNSELERVPPTPEEMEQRRVFAAEITERLGYASTAPIKRGPVTAKIDPGEIAETMARLNSVADIRMAESDRRFAVADDLAARGLA